MGKREKEKKTTHKNLPLFKTAPNLFLLSLFFLSLLPSFSGIEITGVYIGGAFRQEDAKDPDDIYASFSDLMLEDEIWAGTNAPLFSAGWVLSVTANSEYIILNGAINGFLNRTNSKVAEEFLTGIVICSRNKTQACHGLSENTTGPTSSFTRSAAVSGSCLVTASPEIPREIDAGSTYLYDFTLKKWIPLIIGCDLQFCDAVAVWTLSLPINASQVPLDDDCNLSHVLWTIRYLTGDYSLLYLDSDEKTWLSLFKSNSQVSDISWVVQLPDTGNLVVAGTFSLINGVSLNNIAVWERATWTWKGIGNGFDQPPLRLQYLSSDIFFDPPVVAISGNFKDVCDNNQTATLCFWDLESDYYLPVCQTSIGEETTGTLVDYYTVTPLNSTELITDQSLSANGMVFSAIDEIDILDPNPPYVSDYNPHLDDPKWHLAVTTLSQQKSSCRLCSIRFPDQSKLPFADDYINSTLVIFNLADYPRSPATTLEILTAPENQSIGNSVEFNDYDDNEEESGINRNLLVGLYTMYFAEVTAVTSAGQDETLVLGGMFGDQERNFTNLVYRKNGNWAGLSIEKGINNGLVNALLYIEKENVLFIGGLFTLIDESLPNDDDTFFSLAAYPLDDGFDDGEFQPVPGFYGADYLTGEVACLAYSDPYLFVGGTFAILAHDERDNTVTLENLAIWDLEKKNWIANDELGIPAPSTESRSRSEWQARFQASLSVVKVVQAVNHGRELLIGGQFQFTTENGHQYDSLARLDLQTLTWLPIKGFLYRDFGGSLITGAVFTIAEKHFSYQNNTIYIGGLFSTDSGGFEELANLAMCPSTSKQDGLYMGDCFNESVSGGWLPIGGGVDSWVGDIAVSDKYDELIIVGGFHHTVQGQRLETLCPLMTYDLKKEKLNVLTSDLTQCTGFFMTATIHQIHKNWFLVNWRVISISVSAFAVVVLLFALIFLYRQRQMELQKKYGFQEVDRIVINQGLDEEDEEEEHFFSSTEDTYGSIGSIGTQGSRISSIASTPPRKENPFKINVVGIVEASVIDRNRWTQSTQLTYLYAIRVTTGLHSWEVQRSVSDFAAVDKELRKSFSHFSFPDLPEIPKTVSLKTLLKNRNQFQTYLRKLVLVFFNEGVNKRVSVTPQSEASYSSFEKRTLGNVELFTLDPLLERFLFRGRVEEVSQLDASWEVNVGDVRIVRRVGLGSFAEVYEGEWKGVCVAVKVLIPPSEVSVSKDDELSASFAAEVGIMSKLHHPNILAFYGACTRPPNLMMLTEWMPKGDLFNVIGDEHSPFLTFSLQKRLKLILGCAYGLQYMHSLVPPIFHRDMKSLNLLVNEKWEIKISDFGLSKVKAIYKSQEQKKTVVGTAAWMAPEVLMREEYTDKSDIYSLGVIIWEVATCKHPFTEMSYFSMINAGETGTLQLEYPENLPKSVSELIQMCTERNPNLRPNAEGVGNLLSQRIDKLPYQKEKEEEQ